MRSNASCHGQLQKEEMKSLGLTIIVLFSIIHVLLAMLGPMNIMGGELVGNDGYTRLNRVQFIHEHGPWNNSIYPRSNAPYGESIHWTKPMDFILLAGGNVLSAFMPFSTGLHVWGVIISPVLHIVAFAGLFLAAYIILWIVRGNAKVYPILIISGSMFVCSALFLFLERLGEDPFLIEYD